MKKEFIIGLLLCFGLFACGQEDVPKKNEPIAMEQFTSSEEVKAFFTDQLYPKSPIDLPKAELYREYLSAEEVKAEQDKLWKLWQEANASALSTAQMSKELIGKGGFITGYGKDLQTRGVEATWTMTHEQKMKVKMFFKAPSAQERYPMFISLHGGGSYPEVSGAWKAEINTEQYETTIWQGRDWQDAPAFYFVPRMPDDRKGFWHYSPQIRSFKRALQLAMASEIAKPRELYLMGISQGGYGTLRIAQFMPDYFAAIAPNDAVEDISPVMQNLRHTPLNLQVGQNDYAHGRVQYTYKWQEEWQKFQDNNPSDEYIGEIKLIAGKEHGELDYSTMTTWLKQYKRKLYPKHLSYVYHNIDASAGNYGQFSDGVYYLDFRGLKSSSPKAQILFDVVKEGNCYKVKTEAIKEQVHGRLGLYLSEIDYTKPVEILLNGKTVFKETVRPARGAMVESLALFGDPLRIFPAKLSVQLP